MLVATRQRINICAGTTTLCGLVLLAACSGPQRLDPGAKSPAAPQTQVGNACEGAGQDDTGAGPRISVRAGTPEVEQRDTEALITQAIATLRSPTFYSNLCSLQEDDPDLWLSSFLGYRSPAQLAMILTIHDPDKPDAHWSPTSVRISDMAVRNPQYDDGFEGDDDKPGDPRYAGVGYDGGQQDGISTAGMDLGRAHLERWRSKDLVEKSCSINTMAHEISHTLSHHETQHLEYFLDTGDVSSARTKPIASYFVGSLAQCSWLQDNNRVEKTKEALQNCLATFRTNEFRSGRCNDFADPTREVTP